MGAIVDFLFLEDNELKKLQELYPTCKIVSKSDSLLSVQRYRVIIPNAEIEEYYELLVQHGLASSSTNFINRLQSDKLFMARMKEKMAELEKTTSPTE